jgi:hypothetical protein
VPDGEYAFMDWDEQPGDKPSVDQLRRDAEPQ